VLIGDSYPSRVSYLRSASNRCYGIPVGMLLLYVLSYPRTTYHTIATLTVIAFRSRPPASTTLNNEDGGLDCQEENNSRTTVLQGPKTRGKRPREVSDEMLQPGAVAVRGIHATGDHSRILDEDLFDQSPIATVSVASSSPMDGGSPSPTNTTPTQVGVGGGGGNVFQEQAPSTLDPVAEALPPLVEAELIFPPVMALQVEIDASCEINDDDNTEDTSNLRTASPSPSRLRKYRGRLLCGCSITILTLVLCIMFFFVKPVIQNTTIIIDATEMPPIITEEEYGPEYPCYASTWQLLEAQLSDEPTPDAYILCPGTRIKVGSFHNPAAEDYSIMNGDYPIMAIRENITIQCGDDGRHENDCVLDGGFMHVLTLQEFPGLDGRGFVYRGTVDNLKIQGITFTGIATDSGPFKGQSVTMSLPGKNIRLVDCHWENITSDGLIALHEDSFRMVSEVPLEPMSIDVTFEECTFQNIVLSYPLIIVQAQMATVRRCTFRNITLSAYAPQECGSEEEDGVTHGVKFSHGCVSLAYADVNASLRIQDSCVEDFEVYGPGLVIVHEQTDFAHSNLFLKSTNTTCEAAVLVGNLTSNRNCDAIFEEDSCFLW